MKYRKKYAEKSQGNDYYWITASLKLAVPGIAKLLPNKHAFNSLNNYNTMYIHMYLLWLNRIVHQHL